jgi:carboxylesterase type B
LQWVQKYILLFGGDPSRVTIAGESAGGGSVMYHTMAYGGRQLSVPFHNGIAASPYLQPQYAFDAPLPTSRFYEFSTKAGCPSSGSVFDCLVSKDSMTLQYASSNVSTSQTYGTWYGPSPYDQTQHTYLRKLTRS